MKKGFFAIILAVAVILPIALFGCKGKVEKPADTQGFDATQSVTQATDTLVTTEPAQNVATETIPPTAAPQVVVENPSPIVQEKDLRNKDIQLALKNAGFYAGSIDGKIGPKTKTAVIEFQKAKGLKADGKVGPKTWAELEKYLVRQ
ncbi:MAG: peptidoglycan-binding domain-containing protein [Candidatus Omnitrophota bacterium]|jgi:peptidoglycan hydrolase-like protein with peptidoglycan-binding domain